MIGLCGDWMWKEDQIDKVSSEIEESCVKLMTAPEICPMILIAIVAAIGEGEGFGRGRGFAARVGLVPRQNSTGCWAVLGQFA